VSNSILLTLHISLFHFFVVNGRGVRGGGRGRGVQS